MAPNRRRGAGKAAAAAAARKQWKVGDLVLAKVKGFPAWPATVSEPEKWGYSTDWKKVLVYFFGTKQIAFCNPVDVEAFTEEKKKSLLIKRQGKGADFVRAVQEIIDCYDKSKKQNWVDGANLGEEGTVSNAGNLVDSMGKSGKKVRMQNSDGIPSPVSENLCTAAERNESCDPVEVPAAAKEVADLHDMETLSQEPVENASSLDHFRDTTFASSNSLRMRSRDTPLQNCVLQKMAPVRRSRSTSRVDSFKFQNLIMPLNDGSTNTGCTASNLMREESISRNKRIRKSPDSSVWHDMESPGDSAAFVSYVSIEDNGSEIVATNSDTVSLNEGSTLDSSCKTEHPDVEYLGRDVQLSERLHPQDKTTVFRKKRKPNRKRVAHDATLTASPVKVSGLEVMVNKTIPKSPDALKKIHDPLSKADGDEHLPLVKRARVRMGKPPVEEELNGFVDTEEKSSKEVLMNHSDRTSSSIGSANKCFTDRTSLDAKVSRHNGASPPSACTRTENEPLFWKAKKYQFHGCSVDGEAALPPSKRLHRALEAMSANAVEDGQACDEAQGTAKMISSNGFNGMSENGSSHISIDSKAVRALEVRTVNSSGDNDTYPNGVSGSSPGLASPTSEVPEKTSSGVKYSDQLVGSSVSPTHKDCKETLAVTRNFVDLKILEDSSISTHSAETEPNARSPQPSYDFDERQGALASNLGSLILSSPSMKEGKRDTVGLSNGSADEILKEECACSQSEKSDREHAAVLPNHQRFDSVSESKEADKILSLNGSDVLLSVSNGDSSKNTNLLSSLSDEKVKGTCEAVEEVQHKLTQEDIYASPYETSMKVLIAAAQAKRHLSCSTSISDIALDDKVVHDDASSPSLIHTVDSYEQAFPPNSTIIHPSSMDRKYYLQNCNGCLDVLPHHKKATHVLEIDEERNLESSVSHRQKSLDKWTNAEANAARKSFESMLETLSRTKESIGRATRLAIDCAKYGIAGEVVEILARNLESESSLHKRVDLFFLVDSITQCSRGQKGDVGNIYPSAVEAVLPRLLSAAAPPGNAARENRRQCLKVLRLWLERKTLSESIVRHHMRELDSITDASFTSAFARRPSRTERALNDPIREMEGMHVDEYGSNASFQLPGFFMPRMLEDEEESDADEKSFEAVTPEQDPEIPVEQETAPTSTIEKHCHILEDVDGELEMEDVAPTCDVEMNSVFHATGVDTVHASLCQMDQHLPLPFAPPLPEDLPPSPPPLPASPPPMVPPPPSLPPPPRAMSHSSTDSADSNLYMSRCSLSNNFQQHMSQQPDTSSVNSSTLDMVNYYGPGGRDVVMQMQRPGSSGSSGPCCSIPGPHPSMQAGNNIQHMDGAPLLSKSYHLQPPPPTLSNQFSYVQTDQRMQSWMEASSSSFIKRSQFGHDMHRENIYENWDRMELVPHEIGERSRVSAPPVHPGPALCENTEASYAPVSYYGPPRAPSQILNRGWSFPPRTLNYLHPTPLRPPESTIPGANAVPNFWRPR